MPANPVNRLRLRYGFILIILATLPCYCAGVLAALVAPKAGKVATPTLNINLRCNGDTAKYGCRVSNVHTAAYHNSQPDTNPVFHTDCLGHT